MGKFVMVRSPEAGVFFGELVSRDDAHRMVTLLHARRCWYWQGAATLSQLATEGTSCAAKCKFPVATEGEHVILGVCEIINVTDRALESLASVPVWSA